jgi:hypothetical protein
VQKITSIRDGHIEVEVVTQVPVAPGVGVPFLSVFGPALPRGG